MYGNAGPGLYSQVTMTFKLALEPILVHPLVIITIMGLMALGFYAEEGAILSITTMTMIRLEDRTTRWASRVVVGTLAIITEVPGHFMVCKRICKQQSSRLA